MLAFHQECNAQVTVAAYPVPIEQASAFGVLEVDADGCIIAFQEKPQQAAPMPRDPRYCLASMGNYLFNTSVLMDHLEADAQQSASHHDFGGDILPQIIDQVPAYAYDFRLGRLPGEEYEEQSTYWRDVGTLDAFYEANLDLRSIAPSLNLYNPHWPIRSGASSLPPAKFTFNEDGRRGMGLQSVVAEGSIISGGTVVDSVLGRNVFVHSYSLVEASVLMDNCHIHRNARVRRAIIDKNVHVPSGEEIGYNLERDRQRFTVTDSGIVVIPKDYVFSK
jgi:glucose-1-phosphate adenylyltransferase